MLGPGGITPPIVEPLDFVEHPVDLETPEEIRASLALLGDAVIDDFGQLTSMVEDKLSADLTAIKSHLATVNNSATQGMMSLLLPADGVVKGFQQGIRQQGEKQVAEAFLQVGSVKTWDESPELDCINRNGKPQIIPAPWSRTPQLNPVTGLVDNVFGDDLGWFPITTPEMVERAKELSKNTYSSLTDAEKDFIKTIYEITLQPDGMLCYNVGRMDLHWCFLAETWCLEDDEQPVPIPEEPIGESYPKEICPTDAIKVEICNLQGLIDGVKEVIEDPSEETALIAWYNCDTRETIFLPVRKDPEGEGWEKAGDTQEILDKLVECLCKLAETPGEDPEKSRADEFFMMIEGGRKKIKIGDCTLPAFVSVTKESVIAFHQTIQMMAAMGTSLQIVGSIPFIGKVITKPGFAMVFLLWTLVVANRVSLEIVKWEPALKGDFFLAYLSRTYWTFWERVLPGTFIDQIQAADNYVKLAIPKGIPDQGNVNLAFLAGEIDIDRWECYTRANGNDSDHMAAVLKAQRSKLRPEELTSLYNRKEINIQEFVEGVRSLGFLDEDTATQFKILSEQIPQMPDLIRMMVRDVEDRTIVDRFDLEADFNTKFTGRIKEWAEWQNIPTDVMLKNWAAHWRYPGYRQLTEAMHRFRHLPVGDPIRTTQEDVKIALIADDVPEFWVDRMIAMSFNPLTRIDARRAFRIGAIDEQELAQSYQDLGYSDISTDQMVKFTVADNNKSFMTHSAVKQLADGTITYADFIEWMKADGATTDILDMAGDRAELLRRVKTTKECIEAIKDRFLHGEIAEQDLLKVILSQRIEVGIADSLVKAWICEKSSRGKRASLSLLCGWHEQGILSNEEYHDRLLNLGWSGEDATRIVRTCVNRIQSKISKRELATMRRRETEEKRAAAAETRRLAKITAEREGLITAAQRTTDKARKSRLQQDKIIGAAAKKFSTRIDADFVDIFAELKSLFNRLNTQRIAHPDALAAAIKQIADDVDVLNLGQFQASLLGLLSPAASFAQ